jgi:hypothetical protein
MNEEDEFSWTCKIQWSTWIGRQESATNKLE